MSRVIQGSSRPWVWVSAEVVSKRLGSGSAEVGEVGGSMETGGEEGLFMGLEVDGGEDIGEGGGSSLQEEGFRGNDCVFTLSFSEVPNDELQVGQSGSWWDITNGHRSGIFASFKFIVSIAAITFHILGNLVCGTVIHCRGKTNLRLAEFHLTSTKKQGQFEIEN